MLKFLITALLGLHVLSAQVITRKPLPNQIKEEAQLAVKALALEVMKDNFAYSLDHMYPRWKQSTAKEVGGAEVLKQALENAPRKMKSQGISIIDLQVGTITQSFEVNATIFSDLNKAPVFSEYLAFVPTTTFYRAVDPNSGTIKRFKINSYQVAIRTIKGGEWSFIDGSSLDARQLRSLFPNLPKEETELNLPKRGMEETK